MDAKKILVLDSTLREGEQAVGIRFSLTEKIAFVQKLKDFGLGLIEIGHPGVSPSEEEICKTICTTVGSQGMLVHARACEKDVYAAINTQAQWIGIWASYNDISLATKFNNKSRAWVKAQVQLAVSFAKQHGLLVRFTIEDASRTELELIYELGSVALSAGADRISLADTVGAWHPRECYKTVKSAIENFSCEIEVHLHNDLGLAHANAIAAIDAGATIVDASVLGIGERAGICDLFAICATLEKFYGINQYNFIHSQELARMLTKVGAFASEPHHPIVGKNAFTHVSRYHIDATEINPEAYETLKPETFGAQRQCTLNALSRENQQRFSSALYVRKPFLKTASELLYHRDGVGTRWVLMDNRVDERSSVYIIERIFEKDYSAVYEPHVDAHAHHCDSFFVFMGSNPDGSGLSVSVTFGEGNATVTKTFVSPASVLIPAGVVHSYAYLKGTGRFLNFVLSPSYNESLLKLNEDAIGLTA